MRRKLLVGHAVVSGLGFGMVGPGGTPATAHHAPLENYRGAIQTAGLGPLLCAGTPLAPTIQSAIYDENTETYFNPYTPDGSSPGLIGWGSMLGLL